jgi:hypothetical protein
MVTTKQKYGILAYEPKPCVGSPLSISTVEPRTDAAQEWGAHRNQEVAMSSTALFGVMLICWPDFCAEVHSRVNDMPWSEDRGYETCNEIHHRWPYSTRDGGRIIKAYCQFEPDRPDYTRTIRRGR